MGKIKEWKMTRRGDLYGRCITVLYGSHEDIDKLQQKFFDPPEPLDPACAAHWFVYKAPSGHESDYLCFFDGDKSPEYWASLVSHECLHLVAHAFRRAGLPLVKESEEAYTYYHSWLVGQVLNWLWTKALPDQLVWLPRSSTAALQHLHQPASP